jgi:glycosyltransferase involved in cell wall biosynthesis
MENNIDIVHTHSSRAGFLGRKSAHAAKIPIIVHSAHGFSFHEYQNPIIHRFYVLLERIVAKRSSALIAGGNDVKEYGLKKNIGSEDMYSVMYAGVDLDTFRKAKTGRSRYLKAFGLESAIFTVGMVGNLKKQKNPMEFVEIAKLVLDTERDIQFIFAGDGPLRKKVDKKLHKYGIEDKVKLVGWVDNPQDFMHCIDVFLLTSLWEGLPCTLSQAIAAGKPCLATRIGGNKEILQKANTGYLYEPGQVEEATKIIHSIKNNDQKKVTIEKSKEAYLKSFDFEHILEQHEQLYDKLLSK